MKQKTSKQTVAIQTTSFIRCKCTHSYQDEKYGLGVRLHNLCLSGRNSTSKDWRCTVCGDKKEFQAGK